MSDAKVVRIGGACGFWGDSSVAAAQLVRRAEVGYLAFDYLAELTLSILAAAKAKDPSGGWARDFVDVALEGLLPEISARGIKLVTNAGGMNPRACAAALAEAAHASGVSLRIAVVEGDDVLGRIADLREAGLALPARIASANAYFGAFPIAAALGAGAQIVITGRCVDSALVLGPLVHEFGWTPGDLDLLAHGSLAGHLLECGAQGSGGLFTDWELVERWDDIGYPIAECSADGSFTITKAPGTGGRVTPAAVAEQMLYEIGDPAAYVLPDVTCDFTGVSMTVDGEHRVRVAGARGHRAPDAYKVAATYVDGFRCTGTLVIIGIDAASKARRTAEAIIARTRAIFATRGFADYRSVHVEVIGAESSYGPHARTEASREVMMRVCVDHADRRALEIFAREIAPAGTSWSPGTTGAGSGRPKPVPLVKFTSFMIGKAALPATVEIDGERHEVVAPRATAPASIAPPAAYDVDAGTAPVSPPPLRAQRDDIEVPLVELAWARSGDKGDAVNIGIIARRPEYVPLVREQLRPERVAEYFRHLVEGDVRRYDVPGIGAFNFTLERALGGGGMASPRIDPLGKGFAQMLLDIPIAVPASLRALLDLRRPGDPVGS